MFKKLKQASEKTRDSDCFKILTAGMTYVKNKYMYLDRDKYSGTGRPKITDYVNSQPLYIDNA